MNTDRELVEAVLARRQGAFEQLVRQHERLVWHLIQRMINDSAQTQDLAQEVFLRVHRKLARFRFESALSTWIGRIAFNTAARYCQKKRLPLFEDTEPTAGWAMDDQLIDPADVARDHEQADTLRLLGKAVADLPPLPRTLITLYYLEEMSVPEIAEVTGLATGTIKSHLFRTRKRLRTAFLALQGEPA